MELIADWLEASDTQQRDRAVSALRTFVARGASIEVAAQGMVKSGKFSRDDVLHAIETVVPCDSEEAPQYLMRGRFTRDEQA
ncbi:MAG: hypothetical protein V4773_01285 [Verrucomicrobiota bacterium]